MNKHLTARNKSEHEKPHPSNTPSRPKLLIADDHQLIADAVLTFLTKTTNWDVEIAITLEDALNKLRNNAGKYDVVMLDVIMPGMDGLRSVRHVIDAAQKSSVIIFSGAAPNEFVWQAIELGAKGYIPKSQPLRSLESTLKLILDGNEFVPISLTRSLKEESHESGQLQSKERYILKAVSQGKTNKEIGIELDISEVSVKMHMRNIYAKINAKNRAHAVVIARSAGYI